MKSIVFTNLDHVRVGEGQHAISVSVRALLLGHISNDPKGRIALTGFGVSCATRLFDVTALRLQYAYESGPLPTLLVPGVPTLHLVRERHDIEVEITTFTNPGLGVVADFIAERTTMYAVSPNVLVPVAMKPESALAYLRRVEHGWGLLPKDLTKPRPGFENGIDEQTGARK